MCEESYVSSSIFSLYMYFMTCIVCFDGVVCLCYCPEEGLMCTVVFIMSMLNDLSGLVRERELDSVGERKSRIESQKTDLGVFYFTVVRLIYFVSM